jgi:tRNA modification GTPase
MTSSQVQQSRAEILEEIKKTVGNFDYLEEAVISTARQLEQAEYSFEMISKSLRELENNMGAEFVAMYLKESLVSLQKILGQVYDDQIMDRVFKEFCLGK